MSQKPDPNHFSRRDFVKGSAALVGGALISQFPVGPGAYAAGTDAIKIAVIGCGGRGTGAVDQALKTKENVKLVAMVDAFKDRLDESYKNLTTKHPSKDKIDVPEKNRFVGFDGYKQAIALADVVILATPPGFRPIHFEEAVKQGKHVFMEKPVAVDAPGIRRVLAAAEMAKQKKLNVVVGLQRRYQLHYREALKRLNDGAIGDITGGQVYWNDAGVWVRPRVAGQTEMEYQMRNWYYFVWLCGDHILEQHVHNIDVANWVKNGYPVQASGMGGRQVRNGKEHGEIFDHHAVEFTYADGAVISSQCRHMPGCAKKVAESFQGTKGKIDLTDGRAALTDWKGSALWSHRPKDDPNPYQVEHDELFANIRSGSPAINNTEYGAKSTMTAIMGRMATYTGQVVTWDEALNSTVSLLPTTFAWDAPTPTKPDANGMYPVPVPGKSKV